MSEPRLVLVTDLRLAADQTAVIPPLPERAWGRYQPAGVRLRLVARGSDRAAAPGPGLPADVELLATPDFTGPASCARALPALARLGLGLPASSAVLLRLPSVAGVVVGVMRQLRGRLYAVEVAGDIGEVLRSGALGSAAARLAPVVAAAHRQVVRRAVAAVYVTPRSLQAAYPPAPHAPTAAVSDVQLAPEDLAEPRPIRPGPPWRLVAVGAQERAYKGHDVLLRALAQLREHQLDVRLDLVGGGRLAPSLAELAAELGLGDDVVRFHGQLSSRAQIREILDAADLFVMPSLTEGLPRALLEAMARGLPAVVSRVGGMPDVVDAAHCVRPGDVADLAEAVRLLLLDPALREAQARAHLVRAREFAAADPGAAMTRWFDRWWPR